LALAGGAGSPAVSEAQTLRWAADMPPLKPQEGRSSRGGDPILVMARHQRPWVAYHGAEPSTPQSDQTGALASHDRQMFPSCHPGKGKSARSSQYGAVSRTALERNQSFCLPEENVCVARSCTSKQGVDSVELGEEGWVLALASGRWRVLGLRTLTRVSLHPPVTATAARLWPSGRILSLSARRRSETRRPCTRADLTATSI
jgi:hypothetical protein